MDMKGIEVLCIGKEKKGRWEERKKGRTEGKGRVEVGKKKAKNRKERK